MNSKGNVPSAAKPVKDLGGLMRWRKYVKCHYSQKHYVFFILALDTGIAPGKLLKLTWEQIENQTIFDPVSGEQLEMTPASAFGIDESRQQNVNQNFRR